MQERNDQLGIRKLDNSLRASDRKKKGRMSAAKLERCLKKSNIDLPPADI